ncbi:YegS/Rv2252/BmrU family lipid kinase [Aquirufa nivalisilvae]|uniref:Diacylglycerol kinase (ATP) n=1 Tax=Aquirufa nivalisilvae TaxID=2516557 RepID=A0A2S2DUR2_9BACT|nr:YegS/Rv2252/BmrU family lipid kinase [Aquirufa nivalisilvae]AWL09115.1 Diacylglycerol kinase (ATP) [Aquirufa nivalisilvae]MCZ2481108.1 YegS/Rv2252/BmrU family lipid kinase [Aquirufa nivalisilvae]MCZ2482219.1 YegS/Rv2252/BmrU family lipid kinase [Aquirufa nivalisilvae]
MIHFIYNPNSGSKSNASKKQMLQKLEKIENSQVHLTQYAGHAHDLALKAVQNGAQKVVAIGGDGTIHEIASALIGTNTALGIIPIGSGNGLARHLGIHLSFSKALQQVIQGNEILIDVAFWNKDAFFCTAGIGFDAEVAHQFAKGEKRGLINYIRSSFKSVLQYQPIQILQKDETREDVFSMTFANANQFGNNAFISPYSNLQDGNFEVVKVEPLTIWESAQLGISLFLKNISQHKKVSIQSYQRYDFSVPIGTLYHMDGENLQTKELHHTIKIIPKFLRVIL